MQEAGEEGQVGSGGEIGLQRSTEGPQSTFLGRAGGVRGALEAGKGYILSVRGRLGQMKGSCPPFRTEETSKCLKPKRKDSLEENII